MSLFLVAAGENRRPDSKKKTTRISTAAFTAWEERGEERAGFKKQEAACAASGGARCEHTVTVPVKVDEWNEACPAQRRF